ncbi:flagellar motor switch protein FliN [Treponema sp.]|jgi:flagellar motor switch protein FliN/FliY|uniref:flagellar motor switch protein FliN n=1 Tax=Treponema sp. TaxID=166 RepID=UPI00257A75A5|nr:flagellar motor switch protein FliN [Treponema sp.]MBE6354168.1 flagellar motor switch protein FliN [Treponema sp.]
MSEGSISQEEIDALLSGVDMGGLTSGGTSSIVPEANIDVPTLQNFVSSTKDKFAEVIKNMTEKDTVISSAEVEVSDRDVFMSRLPEELIAVMADYSTGLIGDHLFVMSNELATKLVGLINKEDNPALDDMGLSVLSEVISSMSGSEITELSKGGKLPGLVTNPPEAVSQPKAMVRMPQNKFALVTFQLNLDGQDYTLWEAIGGSVAEGMARALGGGAPAASAGGMGVSPAFTGGFAGGTAAGAAVSPMMMTGGGMQQPMMGMQQPMMGMQQPMMGMQQPMMGMQQPMMGMQQPMMQTPPNVQSLQFPNLMQPMTASEQGNIGLIMDVKMEMTVELGRTERTIKNILGMGEGTIIELDKLAGEPVDILVNHKPIAKGEVVVIDENFGVRVTEILPAIEHVASQM